MRNRFDYIFKQVGQKALGPSGIAVTQDAINPETQYADLRYEPDPARQAERDRLGLLGQLAAWPCIIEVYSDAPNAEEFRACLLCRTRHNRHYADQRIIPTSCTDSTVTPIAYAA
jgi:hypothetical protein